MKWGQIIEAAVVVGGSAAAIGLAKRLGAAEWLAARFGATPKQTALAGSVLRTAAAFGTAAIVPATAPYALPLGYASVSELVSSSIKPPNP